MKARATVSFLVVIAAIGLLCGSRLGYWRFEWVFVPLFAGVAVLAWGAVNINSQLFVKTECAFVPKGKEVMLTFDDGPDPGKTPEILALLEKYGAKGVFFCIGKKVDAHPQTAKMIGKKGHALGSHSYNHGNLFDLLPADKIAAELQKPENAINHKRNGNHE